MVKDFKCSYRLKEIELAKRLKKEYYEYKDEQNL